MCCHRSTGVLPLARWVRGWYKQEFYAPVEFTGYPAVVIPGVTERMDAADAARTQGLIALLAAALDRASAVLEAAENRDLQGVCGADTPCSTFGVSRLTIGGMLKPCTSSHPKTSRDSIAAARRRSTP